MDRVGLQNFNGKFVLVDGTIIATGWSDLTDGSLQNPISVDESGGTQTSGVWTNTLKNGIATGTDNCLSWTDGSSAQFGAAGAADAVTEDWTTSETIKCNNTLRLYCVQVQ